MNPLHSTPTPIPTAAVAATIPPPKLYYNSTLEEYQSDVNAALLDTAFIAKVHQGVRDIETKGYAVIEGVVEDELTAWAFERFWELINTASSGRLQQPHGPVDLQKFKFGADWLLNSHGILQDGELAHLDFVHSLRLHPRVMLIFAMIYGAESGLVVATDRLNLQLPKEWLPRSTGFRKEWIDTQGEAITDTAKDASWLHCDQAISKQGRYCIQGLIVGVDADQPGDASLELVEGSHLKHSEYLQLLDLEKNPKFNKNLDWLKFSDEDKEQLTKLGFFKDFKVVRATRGSLILWDSRTAHQGGQIRAHPTFLPRQDPRYRFVVYVCAMPTFLQPLSIKEIEKKKMAFTKLRATSHWALKTKIFGPPQTYNRELPVFEWKPLCVKPLEHPGTFPIMEDLYGIGKALNKINFCPPNATPLLEFATDSGVKKAMKKRKEPETAAAVNTTIKRHRVEIHI